MTSAARVAQFDLSHGQNLANVFVEFGGQTVAFPLLRQGDFRGQGSQPRLIVESMRFQAVVQPAPQRPHGAADDGKEQDQGPGLVGKAVQDRLGQRQGGLPAKILMQVVGRHEQRMPRHDPHRGAVQETLKNISGGSLHWI